MKLLIIRHADPNYEIDSLTETGWKEADLLTERLKKEKIDYFYCSPYGRAKDTAKKTLEYYGKEAVILDWLKEFPGEINRPDVKERKMIAWDWLPEDWTREPDFYDIDLWKKTEVMKNGRIDLLYDEICQAFDHLLSKHGYVRNGMIYDAVDANSDTLAIFCHFGLGCVLLSHLLNISPMQLWHGFCAAPSSVSTLWTEERRKGKAIFRAASLGDISHLYAGGREPSFAARFCSCYKNNAERHD